ncbi:MAG TPA: Arc family DNA-binding protein [Rhizomicrobium sp.]|nr:Arc family DNA-binding protein [Rhizomicrobium sp.]
MPVNLSIRDVPDAIADRLRARAKRNHRSLQGELMALLEQSVAGGSGLQDEAREFRSPEARPGAFTKELLEEISRRARERGLYRPGDVRSVDIIRRMRDERYGLPKK